MAIDTLDHYSIRTTDLGATKRFYTEVMGFEDGPRPPFNFPGAWLYQHGKALVHVVGIDPNDLEGLRAYLGDNATEPASGGGAIDHLAFVATDLAAVRARFEQRGVAFRERMVPSLNLHQLFVEDPNGVTIELNFPT